MQIVVKRSCLRANARVLGARLEGFKEPWDVAVYKGKSVPGDKTLEEAGVTADAPLITVRRVLLPEGTPSRAFFLNSLLYLLLPVLLLLLP
jgi:hypothetical protein